MLSNSEQVIGLILLISLGLFINIPKFKSVTCALDSNSRYKIFPWQKNGFETLSNPMWIGIHIFTAVLLYFTLAIFIIDKNQKIKYGIYFAHTIFSSVILFNISRLGRLSILVSSIVNIGMIMLLTSLLWLNQIYIYILVLSIPIYIEVIVIVGHLFNLIYKRIFD